MGRVIVGVDPHKKSVTIEVVDEQERVLAKGRFDTTSAGYRSMLRYVSEQWRDRRWAVEGANGMGRPLAQRLLAQGEPVLDVPAKLAARVRVFDTGNARKTDAVDAHAIAMVALRTPGCPDCPTRRTWSRCGCWPTAATSCPGCGCRRSTACTGCSPS
jgi:transposase